jgi:Phage head-tail joining protein
LPDNPSGQLPASNGIGSLKWPVTLYRRDQAPADDLALQEVLVPIARTRADVQPAFASTFYQSTQVDAPVTHIINIRWQPYLVTADVVVRSAPLLDGTYRTELFRVRRSKELAGRKRFIQMECELEHARITPDDSDGTRNVMLTEPYDGAAAAPPGVNPQ